MKKYNSAKDVPHFCPKGLAARRKLGLGQITGGEHISPASRDAQLVPLAKCRRGKFAYGKL